MMNLMLRLKKWPLIGRLIPKSRKLAVSVGTVKWFNKKKGFGFIRLDSGQEVFAHISNIQTAGYKTLKKGQRVQFVLSMGTKGPQAENISQLR